MSAIVCPFSFTCFKKLILKKFWETAIPGNGFRRQRHSFLANFIFVALKSILILFAIVNIDKNRRLDFCSENPRLNPNCFQCQIVVGKCVK